MANAMLRLLLLESFLLYSVFIGLVCGERGYGLCGRNEEYAECVDSCRTCACRDDCMQTDECRPGCHCIKGYFRNNEGNCVPEEFCEETCGPNQYYSDCGTSCPDTCENYGMPRPCTRQCVEGCFCNRGLVRNNYGECVIPERCGKIPGRCGRDKTLYKCTPSCKNTCKNYNNPGIRCACGPPGCFCKEGLVKDEESGECVRPQDCPGSPPECGENEEYSSCVIPCNDCETKGDCEFLVCKEGCDCIDCHYRNKTGSCIHEDECPNKQHSCGKDENFVDCVPCGNTCETYEQRLYCKPACRPGCTCKEGLVKRKDGKCVPPEKCTEGPEKCGRHEQYYGCIPSCRRTCETYDKEVFCSMICIPGCFCKEGLVKRKDGKCVKPEECSDVPTCGRNEKYSTCVNPCNDCEIKGKCNFLVCNKGCDCIEGHYRDEKGICIPEPECRNNQYCGPHEEYKKCGSACPPTCENRNSRDHACSAVCREGCFCKKGYIRQKDGGKCIHESQCPRGRCGLNAYFSNCASRCPPTCKESERFCAAVCVDGCVCNNPHHVFDDKGNCVPRNQCPKFCGRDAHFSHCAPLCPPTCNKSVRFCPAVCVNGCVCNNPHHVFDGYGNCIPRNQCHIVH